MSSPRVPARLPGLQRLACLPKLLSLAALLCLTCLSWPAALPALGAETRPAPAIAPSISARLPHDPEAFTQGLLLHHGLLYESTGLYGQSSVRRVDPASGRVLARRDLPPRLFGEGLALCPADAAGGGMAGKARLLQLTWREGLVLAYDPTDLRPLARLRLRGEGWGLACQGAELVLSDGTDTLRWLDTRTLARTGRSLRVRDGQRPVERLNELEWVNGWLVANVWQEDRIAVIRPDSGQVALWLDLAPLRRELSQGAEAANGIAYDPAGNRGAGALYLTGKRWGLVFVVEMPELMRQPPRPGHGT